MRVVLFILLIISCCGMKNSEEEEHAENSKSKSSTSSIITTIQQKRLRTPIWARLLKFNNILIINQKCLAFTIVYDILYCFRFSIFFK